MRSVQIALVGIKGGNEMKRKGIGDFIREHKDELKESIRRYLNCPDFPLSENDLHK